MAYSIYSTMVPETIQTQRSPPIPTPTPDPQHVSQPFRLFPLVAKALPLVQAGPGPSPPPLTSVAYLPLSVSFLGGRTPAIQ